MKYFYSIPNQSIDSIFFYQNIPASFSHVQAIDDITQSESTRNSETLQEIQNKIQEIKEMHKNGVVQEEILKYLNTDLADLLETLNTPSEIHSAAQEIKNIGAEIQITLSRTKENKSLVFLKPMITKPVNMYLLQDETFFIPSGKKFATDFSLIDGFQQKVPDEESSHDPEKYFELSDVIRSDFQEIGKYNLSFPVFQKVLQESFTTHDLTGYPLNILEEQFLWDNISHGQAGNTEEGVQELQGILKKLDPRLEQTLAQNKGVDNKYGYATSEAVQSLAVKTRNAFIHEVRFTPALKPENFEVAKYDPLLRLQKIPNEKIEKPEMLHLMYTPEELDGKMIISFDQTGSFQKPQFKQIFSLISTTVPPDKSLMVTSHATLKPKNETITAEYFQDPDNIEEFLSERLQDPNTTKEYNKIRGWNRFNLERNPKKYFKEYVDHYAGMQRNMQDILDTTSPDNNKITTYTFIADQNVEIKKDGTPWLANPGDLITREKGTTKSWNAFKKFLRENKDEIAEKNIHFKFIVQKQAHQMPEIIQKELGDYEHVQIHTFDNLDNIFTPVHAKEYAKMVRSQAEYEGRQSRYKKKEAYNIRVKKINTSDEYKAYQKTKKEYDEIADEIKDEVRDNDFYPKTEDKYLLQDYKEAKEKYDTARQVYQDILDAFHSEYKNDKLLSQK